MPEMRLPACVGVGSRKNDTPEISPRRFNSPATDRADRMKSQTLPLTREKFIGVWNDDACRGVSAFV